MTVDLYNIWSIDYRNLIDFQSKIILLSTKAVPPPIRLPLLLLNWVFKCDLLPQMSSFARQRILPLHPPGQVLV